MKLTIIQVGETPAALRPHFGRYPSHFRDMFDATGAGFTYEPVYVLDGEALPDPATLEGIVITGSAAGVYDGHPWIAPLRAFVRSAYAARTPMLGVCFGHQIMADALGGGVRQSDRGWGLGRQVYDVVARPDFMQGAGDTLAVAASHQDQVVAPPPEAEVFLASAFTPNAGLVYANGAAASLQPHPEFDRAFARGLVELRRGNPLGDAEVDALAAGLEAPLDHADTARRLARFLERARQRP